MALRKNTNPAPMQLHPELQELLVRNGMEASIVMSDKNPRLLVRGHDSPVLSYDVTMDQIRRLTDWGSNFANKTAYTTFTGIVEKDFDMPKDFVHARNANGRVAMGLHGYRIGAGEYGRPVSMSTCQAIYAGMPLAPCLSVRNADNQLFESTTPDFTPKDVKSGVFVFIQMENKGSARKD